jgi:hypothetical protein
MIKNVAGQTIGSQMTTTADGSNFTGTVTVNITIDAGTQAVGTVGAGVCTHEGLGYHSYLPAQAETNGNHIAYTFTGTGAITRTVQVYPSGARADIDAALADYGALRPTVPGRTLNVTAGGTAGINWADVENPNDVVGLTQTTIGAIGTGGITDTSLATSATEAIADGVLLRDWTAIIASVPNRCLLNAARFLRNKWSVLAGVLTVTKEDDTTTAWDGVVTGNPTADPITSVDPNT